MAGNLKKVHWMADANCKGIDTRLFTSFDRDNIDAAKLICMPCKVKAECLVTNFDTPWVIAGMTKYERLKKVWQRIDSPEESNFDGFS